MKKFIVVSLFVLAPFVASAHTHPISCDVPTVASGGGLVYGSGPEAPGWNVNLPDGGQGGAKFIPYNGTTCIFNQGCMIAK